MSTANVSLAENENKAMKGKTFASSKDNSRRALAPICANQGAAVSKKIKKQKVTNGKSSERAAAIVASIQNQNELKTPKVQEVIMQTDLMSILSVEDIDQYDRENAQMCSEYVKDVYEYIFELEKRFAVEPTYMVNQKDITERMRSILIDWLVEVHLKFKLLQETMYLTVTIIDRFLEITPVSRGKLQLVGVTAMLLASKYEEIYAPEVRDFIYITDNAYTREEILQMEEIMLSALKFDFANPLPLHFLRRNSKAAQADATIHTMAKYLMELSLPSYGMIQYLPSEVAAAALHVSLQITKSGSWNSTISHYSGYTEEEIMPCVHDLLSLVKASDSAKLQAVRKKYTSSRLSQVARMADAYASEHL